GSRRRDGSAPRRAGGRAPRRALAPDPAPLRARAPRARRPRGSQPRASRQTIHVTAGELEALAQELGLDAIGAAPAEPYAETERHTRERRAGALCADMRFTMARPEESCHPETLLPAARTVVSAALCYWLPEPERPARHGRLPRYTWFDAYAVLRSKLDELGGRIGGRYRVLVD